MKADWVYRDRKLPIVISTICLAVLLLAVSFCGCLAPSALAVVPERPEQIILTWIEDPAESQAITWIMSEALTAQLQYLEADDFTGNFDSAQQIDAESTAFGSSYRYTAALSGLIPDTQYIYRAGIDGAWSDTLSFTTAADTEEYSFLYMGDVQSGYADWGSMLDSVYQGFPEIEFSLMGGDLTDYDTEWGQFLDAAAGVFSRIPLMPAKGNHDGNMYLQFFALPDNGPEGMQKEFYSFDYGNAHFLVLNSMYNTDETVKQWLREDLQNTTKAWKFTMFHYPAYPAFDDGKTVDDSIRENWVPILEQYGVDMVFVGHQHQYMRTYPIYQGAVQADPAAYGIVYVMGNAGSKYYGAGSGFPYIAAEQTGSSYQVININGDILTMTSNKASGELIDSYTIDKSLELPPALTADTTNNTVNRSVYKETGVKIDIRFDDDASWRAAITGVFVNDNELGNDQYKLTKGKIRIDAGVFTAEGDYDIMVRAGGYEDGTVIQTMTRRVKKDNN
jgi:hypothetical protein